MKDWNDERFDQNKEKFRPTLSKTLQNKLNKKYAPDSRFDGTFKGNDITFLTNDAGDPVILYIGKRKENGDIKGEHYSRRVKKKRRRQNHRESLG